MATSRKVHLDPNALQAEVFVPGITAESAEAASRLLQENHEKHHVFFNQEGFHNHIVHHLLTLYAMGATPRELQTAYNDNANYQRPPAPISNPVVADLSDPTHFSKHLGKEKNYNSFLSFFQSEIDAHGWEAVLQEYVFKGDQRADDMLVRMFSGFLHPIIHLGFGVEFGQPAIIAEALSQAAVHQNWIGTLFYESENAVKEKKKKKKNETAEEVSIVKLLEEMKNDETLSRSAHFKDSNKIRDGIFQRGKKEMIEFASRYRIDEDISDEGLEEKTAEMINASVYFTTTSQHPPKNIKFDFFYMHCVNASIFFSAFLRQTSSVLSKATKIRLLEWKVRLDLAMYVSRGCPDLLLSEVQQYSSQGKSDDDWDTIFSRIRAFEDDGHASKLVRALKNGEVTSRGKEWEKQDGFMIKGDMWRVLANMTVDSVESGGPTWVRSCGFDEAWEGVPEREVARL